MKAEVARRIERMEMQEWDRQYQRLLGPIIKTPDCTCEWETIANWYSGEMLREIRTHPDEDCPDHG